MQGKPQLLVVSVSLALLTVVATSRLEVLGGELSGYPLSKPGCPDTCGNMSIPYPFGTQEGCYLDDTFFINCSDPTQNPPKAFLGTGNLPVTEIMLLAGEVRSLLYLVHLCFNSSDGSLAPGSDGFVNFTSGSMFTLSYTKNKFTVVGCDAIAQIQGTYGTKFRTGCITGCDRLEDVVNGSCAGIGCCQISVPRRIKGLNITLENYLSHNQSIFNPCNSAFVVEQTAYNFSSLDFTFSNPLEKPRRPVIFDWAIGKKSCQEDQNKPSYVCGKNSVCHDYDNGPGYRCNCSDGFRGNPYLSDGCQDIDECTLYNPCSEECHNLAGSFECSRCRKGYKGDGYKNGTGCVPLSSTEKILRVALGTSTGISSLLLAGAWFHCMRQKRKLIQLRKKYYKENGGITLQQLLSRHEREIDAFKIYTADELDKATHNYDDNRILGQGGQGTVYKGELPDTSIVAVKKSNAIDKCQVDQFVNEVVILSQINHRNVVKLLGCCLETEIPMLVYEFITNGTLFDHIQKDHIPQMPWQTRLRIAAEIAGALSYLHSAAAIPIIHRDIKTTNILLDVGYIAKVSDFGTSKFSPVDKTSLTTLVQGTMGYLDPEYFYSSQLTEKSDVYSFGVVLVELLTGERALNFERKEEERSLAMYFVSCIKEDRLDEIVDQNLKRQVSDSQLDEVALMAARCLNVRGEDRPSMKEVAIVLEGLAKREMNHPWIAIDLDADQETEILLHGPVRSDSITLRATNLTNKEGNTSLGSN